MSVPSWDVVNFDCDEDEATFAIRACGKLFIVYMRAGDLDDFSGKNDFLSLIQEALDNYNAEEALYELISDTILEILRHHDSRSIDPHQFTLQEFYDPDTLFFKLRGEGSHLRYLPWIKDRPDLLGIKPSISLSSITDSSEVPHFDASLVKISPQFGHNPDDILSNTPTCVTLREDPVRYHFKAVQDHQSFLREFQILLKIKQSGLNQKHRLPLIHGIVHYSDKPEQVLGVLMKVYSA